MRTAEAEGQQPTTMPIAQGSPIPPPQAYSKPITGTFQTQASPTKPVQQNVPSFGSNTPQKLSQDYIQMDVYEQVILEGANNSTDKLKEMDFINGFAKALQERGRTPDVMRIVQIYRQHYV